MKQTTPTKNDNDETANAEAMPHSIVTQQKLSAPMEWGHWCASKTHTTLMTPPAHVLRAAFHDPVKNTEIAYIVVVGKQSQRPKFQLVVEEEHDKREARDDSSKEQSRSHEPATNSDSGVGVRSQPTQHSVSSNMHTRLREKDRSIALPHPKIPEHIEITTHEEEPTSAHANKLTAASLLTKLAESEKKQRKMQIQLAKSGITSVASGEDIPYHVAKQKIAEISERMNTLLSGETPDAKDEYFKLEKEMEKYNAAIVLTDEYQLAQEEAEHEWECGIVQDNAVALAKLRRHMPVNVRRMTVDELKINHPDLPEVTVKRFKRTNILTLLRVDPVDIKNFHPSMLESMPVSGLTLTERRALHAHLAGVGEQWKEKSDLDSMTSRKYKWFAMMKTNFREALNKYENHAAKFCPPNIAHGADCSCTMKGRGCPIRADALVDYNGDYGCPTSDAYEATTASKRDEEPTQPAVVPPASWDPADSTTEKAPKISAVEIIPVTNRRSLLKTHYKRNLLQVNRANVMCESIEEITEECNVIAGKCEGPTNGDDFQLIKEVTVFSDSLKRLLQSLQDRVTMLSKGQPSKPSNVETDLVRDLVVCLQKSNILVVSRMESSTRGKHIARMLETTCAEFEDFLSLRS